MDDLEQIDVDDGNVKVAKFSTKLLAVAARAIANKILGLPRAGFQVGGGRFDGMQAGTDIARPIIRVDDGWGFVVDSDVTKRASDPTALASLTLAQKTKLTAFVAATMTRSRADLTEDE